MKRRTVIIRASEDLMWSTRVHFIGLIAHLSTLNNHLILFYMPAYEINLPPD